MELRQKIQAIKKNQQSTSFSTASILVYTVAAVVCCFILTSSPLHWLPSVASPILSLFCSGKPSLFILGNLIVLFLVGQSKIMMYDLLPNHSRTDHGQNNIWNNSNKNYNFSSSSTSISSPAAASQSNKQYCSFPSVPKTACSKKKEYQERKQGGEEDYCSYQNQYQRTTILRSSTTIGREDELTKRADDFIAKVNRRIKIDCYVNS